MFKFRLFIQIREFTSSLLLLLWVLVLHAKIYEMQWKKWEILPCWILKILDIKEATICLQIIQSPSLEIYKAFNRKTVKNTKKSFKMVSSSVQLYLYIKKKYQVIFGKTFRSVPKYSFRLWIIWVKRVHGA